jgi:hypothetical protein
MTQDNINISGWFFKIDLTKTQIPKAISNQRIIKSFDNANKKLPVKRKKQPFVFLVKFISDGRFSL